MLCVLVNIGFQVLFHSPPGVLFTFPSQYFSTIGHQVVFRLGEWSPRLLCGFHVSADTLDTVCCLPVSPKRLSLAPVAFPTAFGYNFAMLYTVLNPKCIATPGLASSAFARHYSQNLGWFLFLWVLRCFSSPRSPRKTMYSSYVLWFFTIVVPKSEIYGSMLIYSSP